MAAKLSIVIPAFDYWLQTQRCLDSLLAGSHQDIEIIVVDHGLTEDTKQGLIRYPEVIRIRADSSLWWTGATNVGVRAALNRGARLVMLLNSDCYVAYDTVETLLRHHHTAGTAVIAPVQKDAASGVIRPYWATTCFLLGFPTLIPPKLGDHKRLAQVKLIMGGRGVLIPGSVFAQVGLFDEEALPHYGADHDFYLRCRRQGVPLLVATDAVVYADDSRTTLAAAYGRMSWKEFAGSLKERRSHRNMRDLTTLFKRHYPIKGLHHVGVALNVLRYFLMYVWHRSTQWLLSWIRR